MLTAIASELHGHWSAWFEGNPESAFGGDTPTTALERLTATLDGFDVNSIVADNERTRDGHLVFVIGDVCEVL